MVTQARPSILCTKCHSSVPWGAHCPHCWAYLEFAGDPPWRPEDLDEGPDEEGEVVQSHEGLSPEGDVAKGRDARLGNEQTEPLVQEIPGLSPVDSSPPVRSSAPPSSEENLRGEPESPTTVTSEDAPKKRPSPFNVRQIVAGVAVTILTIVLMVPVTSVTGWWFPVLLGPPLLAALLAAAYLAFLEIPAPVPVAVVPDEEAEETFEEEDFDPSAYTPQELQARRVMLQQKVVEHRTTGDAPCAACERLNPSSSHFCDWCGAVMPGVQLAPVTQAVVESAEKGKRKKRRGPTRTWRSTGPVFLIVAMVVGALAFAFLGPGAFQSRLSLTRVVQGASQWVNPMVGRAARVSTVTASSTLPGTTPMALIGNDASTFWAAGISPAMGENSVLTFTFDAATEIDRMVILPGIQNRIFGRRSVAYPRTMTLTFDDGSQVQDSIKPIQSDEDLKQLIRFPARTTKTVTLKVTAVYLPLSYKSGDYGTMAISGVEFLEPPQPPSAFGIQDRGLQKPTMPGAPGLS